MIDLRRVRVGIEINDKLHIYEGLNIKATGTKHANPLQNECEITIYGLNRETRQFILTEASQSNDNRTPKRVIVECGRESLGLFTLFIGDITKVEPSLPPDVVLTIKAKTNNANSGKIISESAAAMIKLSELSKRVASNNDVELYFQATDKNIANYSFSGVASKQIQDLQDAGDVRAFVDDGVLIVKDRGTAVDGRRRILNAGSGMVGLPKATDKGLEVTYLIDSESELGGQLTIESNHNPALNGDWVINQLKFNVATHDHPFFYTALCERLK